MSGLLPEFVEMLCALSDAGAEYVVVGGYAVGFHVEPRATKDIDILVRPSPENARRVLRALDRFGAARRGLTAADLATPGMVFQIGVPPRRVDILTQIRAVEFDEAWASRVEVPVEGLPGPMFVLGLEPLLRNKRAVGRPQDVADVARLLAARDARGHTHAPSRTARHRRGRRRG